MSGVQAWRIVHHRGGQAHYYNGASRAFYEGESMASLYPSQAVAENVIHAADLDARAELRSLGPTMVMTMVNGIPVGDLVGMLSAEPATGDRTVFWVPLRDDDPEWVYALVDLEKAAMCLSDGEPAKLPIIARRDELRAKYARLRAAASGGTQGGPRDG